MLKYKYYWQVNCRLSCRILIII